MIKDELYIRMNAPGQRDTDKTKYRGGNGKRSTTRSVSPAAPSLFLDASPRCMLLCVSVMSLDDINEMPCEHQRNGRLRINTHYSFILYC